MKIHNHIYMLLAAMAIFLMAACSPEDYKFGKTSYSPDELTEGDAYTVTIDGNVVTLKSNIPGCTPLWVTPSGRSQNMTQKLELPFAGDYEVTFGVETEGGIVYGAPYKFNLPQNDFSLLNDNKWFFLADKDYKSGDFPDAETLSVGVSKRWRPMNVSYSYGGYHGSSPVMYIAPYDPDGDGKGFTAEEKDDKNVAYRDITFGSANWKENWDPGYQSWLIPADDAYMDSWMEFSMDAQNGCVAKMYRGESGKKGSSQGSNMVGKFNMNLDDKNKPLISFTDCYAMHNVGFDAVCSNYTQDIQIIELTPYVLQLVTKRTNSEGNWYICWNFVSDEVIETNGECVPRNPQPVETVSPKLPDYPNLESDLFLTEINGDMYAGQNVARFILDSDKPYDILWWNNTPFNYSTKNDNGVPSAQEIAEQNAAHWNNILDGNYNTTWAPKMSGDAVEAFELEITKPAAGKDYYKFTCGDVSGKLHINKGVLTFSKEITLAMASSDNRTIKISGRQFTVLKNDPAGTLTIGVPEGVDENGKTNSYLVANLKYKPVASSTGPKVVALDQSKISEHIWTENGALRLAFHSYGSTGKGIFKDAQSVKLKNGQTITVTFKINGGVTWNQAPKCALIDNNIKTTWEPGCYDLSDAVTVNTNGETTVSLTNNSGETKTFFDTCLDLSIQLDGYGTLEGEASGVSLEIVSCTIQ